MSELKEKVVECKQCLNPNMAGLHTCGIYNKQQEQMNKYEAMVNKVESELKTNSTNSYNQNYSFNGICPCCGYCPHCGRNNDHWYFRRDPYKPYITYTTSSGTK